MGMRRALILTDATKDIRICYLEGNKTLTVAEALMRSMVKHDIILYKECKQPHDYYGKWDLNLRNSFRCLICGSFNDEDFERVWAFAEKVEFNY